MAGDGLWWAVMACGGRVRKAYKKYDNISGEEKRLLVTNVLDQPNPAFLHLPMNQSAVIFAGIRHVGGTIIGIIIFIIIIVVLVEYRKKKKVDAFLLSVTNIY